MLAAEVEQRERVFAVIRSVFTRYGFEPLQTPAFERLDVLLGKYGDDADMLRTQGYLATPGEVIATLGRTNGPVARFLLRRIGLTAAPC